MNCLPEGLRLQTPENEKYFSDISSLTEAIREKKILEAVAFRCTESHDLLVDLHIMYGRIPREETDIGISEGTARDIAACFQKTENRLPFFPARTPSFTPERNISPDCFPGM